MTVDNVIQFPRKELQTPQESSAPSHSDVSVCSAPGTVVDPFNGFDVRPYLPAGRKVHFEEDNEGAYFIPHKLHEFVFKATDTKLETRVFACLVRFALGFRRPTCEAGLTFVSRWTGLKRSSAHKGLESLRLKGLVVRLEVGTCFEKGSIFEIPVVKGYLEHLSKISKPAESSPSGPTKIAGKKDELSPNHEQYCIQNTDSTVSETRPKKENPKKDLKHTLNPEEYLNSYFENIRQKKKKQSEWRDFKKLKVDAYTLEEIKDAVNLLLEEGIPQGNTENPRSKVECYFPMAFLLSRMDWVLQFVSAHKENNRLREERRRLEEQRRHQEAQDIAEDSARYADDLGAFNRAFPTSKQQEGEMMKFASQHPLLVTNRHELKRLSVKAWAAANRLNQLSAT